MRVTNCRKETQSLYIGRPSKFGNPFIIGPDGDREMVIALYEKYARGNPSLLEAIRALPEDTVLGCWCAPKPCHGDVIVKLWKEMHP